MKISVVIPVFNTARYLPECVDSLVAQTMFNEMELILVDDGSTDSSPAVCDEYAGKYDNIRVIHRENAGVSAARNVGIDAAHGDYVGFVDSDDIVYPDMYRLLYEAAEKTGADMTFCGMEHPRPDKTMIVEYPFENDVLLGGDAIKNTVAPFMLEEASFNSLCNKLFRRSVVEQNGLRLSVGKKHGEDREFVIRFLLVCRGVCGVEYIGYLYRYLPTSAVNKPRTDYSDTIFEQYALDRLLFSEMGMDSERFNRLTATSVVAQLVSAAWLANEGLKGAERKRVMRSIIKNDGTQKLISDNHDLLMSQNGRYDALLIKMIHRKSMAGFRLMTLIMKIRVMIYKRVNNIKPENRT